MALNTKAQKTKQLMRLMRNRAFHQACDQPPGRKKQRRVRVALGKLEDFFFEMFSESELEDLIQMYSFPVMGKLIRLMPEIRTLILSAYGDSNAQSDE